MKEAKSLFSLEKIYKKAILKLVPELEGKDYEIEFKTNLACPDCGKSGSIGTVALFYRMAYGKWIQAGKTFKCSSCRDTEALKIYMENSLREQNIERTIRLIKEYFLLSNHLKEAGFKNYYETNKITASAKAKAISFTKSYLSSDSKNNNLLIMGNPGTGKSHLCAAIARTIKEQGFSVGFLTTGQLLSKIKATYKQGSMKTEEEVFRDIKKLDLLILDDLGSEAIGGNDDWRKGILFEVIECRYGKATIYTSNLTDIDLPVAVGERVFSRLHDNTKFIDLFTDDYRKKNLRIR